MQIGMNSLTESLFIARERQHRERERERASFAFIRALHVLSSELSLSLSRVPRDCLTQPDPAFEAGESDGAKSCREFFFFFFSHMMST